MWVCVVVSFLVILHVASRLYFFKISNREILIWVKDSILPGFVRKNELGD